MTTSPTDAQAGTHNGSLEKRRGGGEVGGGNKIGKSTKQAAFLIRKETRKQNYNKPTEAPSPTREKKTKRVAF